MVTDDEGRLSPDVADDIFGKKPLAIAPAA
jgi:hypothetical protein